MPENTPDVTVPENSLSEAGFTPTGRTRFVSTVRSYSDTLFTKAIAYSDVEKDAGIGREITHEHVRSAAKSISINPPSERSKWWIAGQVFEYIFTAIAGAGVGHLDQTAGIAAFGIGTALAVVLLVFRNIYNS